MKCIDLVILVSIACSFGGGQIGAVSVMSVKGWVSSEATSAPVFKRITLVHLQEKEKHTERISRHACRGAITDMASNRKVDVQEMRGEKGTLKCLLLR